MAMPRKGSRLINVDGAAFRWRIRRRPAHWRDENRSPLTVTIERAEEPGCVLVVSLPCARPDNWRGERTIAVRPALVAGCIRRAIEQGWNPGRPGSAFTLTVTEDELTVLLGEPPQYMVPFLWGMIPEGGGIRDLPRCTEIWSRDGQSTGRAPSDP
ncbi:hypothetical protein [Streptosporangium pseudovulgare]|uniref:Uncharacterized protein n=1 Tax=Streptosporangium pseudovulgare TaxID=35765 RepID=A0ABQ2QTS6_9ACTN|nr:hypothetical protein [Streptosporangium pseudovulgare]GGP94106.1 hypothetical protein GCM10010140_24820 [Streptosporangium pseudovulgare]